MMKNFLTKLFVDDNVPNVKYEDLRSVNPFELFSQGDGIDTERIPVWANDLIKFRVIHKAGMKFQEHYHDCKEIIHVRDGKLEHKGKVYGRGSQIIIQAYVRHGVKALEDSVYYVEFTRPTF